MTKITIGARGSKLSLAYVTKVKELLLKNNKDLKEENKSETETNKMISDIFEKLNLSSNKAEKDIGIYKSSISKMEQAKELIEELRINDKRKNQK